ncbi:MAG: InlB B-repeat-containing protein [Bacilli bacterium]|nr:InlB B-repeat-containing protein [Bacilli bacterium]
MTKKISLLAAASIAAILASCGGGNSSSLTPSSSHPTGLSTSVATSEVSPSSSDPVTVSSEAVKKVVVTFDLNYEGSTPVTAEVEVGKTVDEPSNILRDGYGFAGWYLEASCENAFDFQTLIFDDLTLYANWLKIDENSRTATFHWNLAGQPDVYQTVYFTSGGRVTTKPAKPVLVGYKFMGWYNEATCENEWAENRKYSDNIDVYAKWFNEYVFEAEYTQLVDLSDEDIEAGLANEFGEKVGHGYSSDTYGLANIFPGRDLQASNGFYISNMYYRGAYIEFDIECSKAITDAILVARMTCEYFDMTFKPGYYDFEVNGANLDYSPISMSCKNIVDAGTIYQGLAPKMAEGGSGAEVPFADYNISTHVSFKEGKNVLRLVTNNSDRQDQTGTMAAMAPLVDCLKLYSDAELTFDAHEDNLN